MSTYPRPSNRLLAIGGLALLGTFQIIADSRAEERPVSILAARIGGHIHPSICRTKDGTLVVVYK